MTKTVRATSAQVRAARTLVRLAEEAGRDVDPAVQKIANAKPVMNQPAALTASDVPTTLRDLRKTAAQLESLIATYSDTPRESVAEVVNRQASSSRSPLEGRGVVHSVTLGTGEFDVMLTGTGERKIQVIREVLALTSLSLKEAKDLVDAAGSAPEPVLKRVDENSAGSAAVQLRAAGAQIEIRPHGIRLNPKGFELEIEGGVVAHDWEGEADATFDVPEQAERSE